MTTTPTNTCSQGGAHGIYVASRASIPERPMMWQGLRLKGWPIVSTWIDEAGEGETGDFTELWQRIHDEIASSVGVLLYAEVGDFPLKGALIECGIALGMGKPVAVVLPSVRLEPRSMKPIGSWAAHPNVQSFDDLATAKDWLLAAPASAQEAPHAVRVAGERLASCAFNLAQRNPGQFTERDIETLDYARKEWDAAIIAALASAEPKMGERD